GGIEDAVVVRRYPIASLVLDKCDPRPVGGQVGGRDIRDRAIGLLQPGDHSGVALGADSRRPVEARAGANPAGEPGRDPAKKKTWTAYVEGIGSGQAALCSHPM